MKRHSPCSQLYWLPKDALLARRQQLGPHCRRQHEVLGQTLFDLAQGSTDQPNGADAQARTNTRPGLSRPCGSSACLIWRIRASACASL